MRDSTEPGSVSTLGVFGVRIYGWRGVLVGVFIALVVPISYLVLALLVQNGIAPYDETHALLGPLSSLALSELLLGPIGIVIAGRSGGVRAAPAWLALMVVAVPLLALVWLYCGLTLSGALGAPF